MSNTLKIVLAFVLCVFATVTISQGPLGLADVGERIAIALIWIVGVSFMIWSVAKKSS